MNPEYSERQRGGERAGHGGQPDRLASLRRLAALAVANADPDLIALGERLAAWANGQVHGPLGAALGLTPAPGERSLTTKVAITRRNELYLALAAAHFPNDTRRGRAATIHAALSDYAGRGWLRERGHPCQHAEGSLPFFLWSIMSAHEAASAVRPARPSSAAQIDRLLKSADRSKSPAIL
jgi:hypothetical protein